MIVNVQHVSNPYFSEMFHSVDRATEWILRKRREGHEFLSCKECEGRFIVTFKKVRKNRIKARS